MSSAANRGTGDWSPGAGTSPVHGPTEDAGSPPTLLMPAVQRGAEDSQHAAPRTDSVLSGTQPPQSSAPHASTSVNGDVEMGRATPPQRGSSRNDGDASGSDDENEDERTASPTGTMSTPGAAFDRSTMNAMGMDDAERKAAHDSKYEHSLYLFGPKNPVRIACCIVMRSVVFRTFILLCIVVNGALLAVDEPGRDKSPSLVTALLVCDLVFFGIFALEMLIKIVALGFFMHRGAYLRDRWNVLDCFIVVASAISIIAGSAANVSTLRVFRVLRPLRSIQRVKDLKTLITALFDAIPEVANNLLLFLFILILFGISGVVLFAGDLTFRCYATEFLGERPPRPANETWTNVSAPFLLLDDGEICGGTRYCANITQEYGVETACQSHRDLYYRRNLNFDHLLSGGLLTLKVMTMDDWHEDLGDVMNARGQWTSIWFVVLTFVGAFVVVNLFLAILTQTYHNRVVEHSKDDASTQVTDESLDAFYAHLREDLATSQLDMDNSTAVGSPLAPTANPLMPPPAEMDQSDGDIITLKSRSTSRSGLLRGSSKTRPTMLEMPALAAGAPGPRRASPGRPSKKAPPSPPSGALQRTSSSAAVAAGGIVSAEEAKKRRIDAQIKRVLLIEAAEVRMRDRIRRGVARGEYAFEGGAIDDADISDEDLIKLGDGGCLADMTCARFWGLDEGSLVLADEEDDDRSHWRRRLAAFMDSIGMQTAITIVTLINVATLAVDYHGIDPDLLAAMDMVSIVCTGIYIVNLFFTVVGEGVYRTFRNGFNVLDLLIILISVPDIIFSDGGSAFGVFRIFRLLRLLRFLRIKKLQPIVRTIMDSVTSIGYLSLLILLFLYIFSVTGMQVFGTDFASDAPEERNKFGTIWQAGITTFIAITGENWTTLMRVGMQSYSNGLEIIPVSFFVIVYLFGNYILINLSVAIILDTLESKLAMLDTPKEEIAPPLLILPRFIPPKKAKMSDGLGASDMLDSLPSSPTAKPTRTRKAVVLAPDEVDSRLPPPMPTSPRPDAFDPSMPMSPGKAAALPVAISIDADADDDSKSKHGGPPSPTAPGAGGTAAGNVLFADAIREKANSVGAKVQRVKAYLSFVRPIIVEENSFFVFAPTNCFREAMITVAGSNVFDRFIDLVILVNMFFLVFESPDNSDNVIAALRIADFVFTAVFIIEMLIKMVAFGAVMPEGDRTQEGTGFAVQEAYFRDYWNWIDFVVVTLSIGSYFVPPFRASRALRALRLMTRFETTKIIVIAVLEAIPHVLQTLVFVVFVFFVLGVMGVKFFKGRYYTCNDATVLSRDGCVGQYWASVQGPIFEETVLTDRIWKRAPYHFDHLGSALLSLFVVTVGDGWSDIMFNGMDTDSEENFAMQHGQRDYMSLFFIVVFISCNFFALNMMIGVLVSYFAKKKRLHDGSALLSTSQRMYVKARYAIDATVVDYQVPRPGSVAAGKVDAFLTYRHPKVSEETSLFDLVMMAVILINTVMIASTHDGMTAQHESAIDIASLVALCIFVIEMCLKLFAYGVFQYFNVGWNVFDFVIILTGLVGVIVQQPGLSVFRVLRVFKMIKGTGVERLLISLFRGVSSFINITGILALTFFIFAVAGVILFGEVKLQGAITINYNFRTVPNAMLTLYTVATGSGWAEVMDACGVEPPKCEPELGNCGNLPAAVGFFVSFMVVCSFIVLQLFVAVVVEIFLDDVNFNDPVIVAFATTREIWVERFGASTQSTSAQNLADLLRELPAILTDFNYEATRADVIRLLGTMNVPVDSNFHAQYSDIVHALAFRKFKVDLRSMAKYVNDAVVTVFGTRAFTATQAYSILVIQRAWRKRKEFLAAPVQPLTGISTEVWLQRVLERRARKAEKSTTSTDSMNLKEPDAPPALESFSQKSVTSFVPTGGIAVPGSAMYAFPMPELGHGVAPRKVASFGGLSEDFGNKMRGGGGGGGSGSGDDDAAVAVTAADVPSPRDQSLSFEERRHRVYSNAGDGSDTGAAYTGAAATSDGETTELQTHAQSFDDRASPNTAESKRRTVSFAPTLAHVNGHDDSALRQDGGAL